MEPKSVIQSNNYLAAGICAQEPDGHEIDPILGVPGVDWGYTMLLVLDGAKPYPYIEVDVLKCFEWGRQGKHGVPIIGPLDPPAADLMACYRWWWPNHLIVDSEVTLEMAWVTISSETYLFFYVTLSSLQYTVCAFTPEELERPYFMLGT